jgi:hypothetical protein
MVNTSKYPITVDGLRLDTLAYNISTRAGRDIGIGASGSNIATGLRDGEIWVPDKKAPPGKCYLKMWVAGVDVDGENAPDGDDYYQYTLNLDKLKRIFGVHSRLLDVRQQMDSAGAHIRQALSEVTAMIEPETLAAAPYTSAFSLELSIPGAFWTDVADSNYDSAAALTSPQDLNLPGFALATAPMRDLYVVLDGPATNPKIIDNRNGHYVLLNGSVANGSQWVINTTQWTSKVGVGIAFTQGGTDRYDTTEFAGGHSPSIFGLSADPLGVQVRIEGTGFGAASRLRIRGKLKYL